MFSKQVYILLTVILIISCTNKNEKSLDPSIQDLKLKSFLPESRFKTPKAKIMKAKFPVIDAHSHEYGQNPKEIEERIQLMHKWGVEKTILLTYATGARWDSVYALYSKYSEHFELWCGLDYTNYDKPGYGAAAVAELERCVEMGAKGVGELGDKGWGLYYSTNKIKKDNNSGTNMHIDDPRLAPLLNKCAELNLPINIHIADPIWMYDKIDSTNDGLMNAAKYRIDKIKLKIVPHNQQLVFLENALEKYPKVTFIVCHLANHTYDLDRVGELLDKHPNLFTDISGRFSEMAAVPKYSARFLEKYQDRILFGTDLGVDDQMFDAAFRVLESNDEHWYDIDRYNYHWPLYGLGLKDEILKKIYKQNKLRILGI